MPFDLEVLQPGVVVSLVTWFIVENNPTTGASPTRAAFTVINQFHFLAASRTPHHGTTPIPLPPLGAQ